jgi:hypothetical protein
MSAVIRSPGEEPIPSRSVPVRFPAPTGGASGGFNGLGTAATVITDAKGEAVAPGIVANQEAGPYTVTASVSGMVAPAAFGLTNRPSVPARILATGGTSQAMRIKTAFASLLQATVVDQFDNPVDVSVTVIFSAPSQKRASALFGGKRSSIPVMTGFGGVALAPRPVANSKAGAFTVNASVRGIPAAAFGLTNTVHRPKKHRRVVLA